MRKVGLAIAALTTLMTTGAILTSQGVTPSQSASAIEDPFHTAPDAAAPMFDDQSSEDPVDLFGNPVSDAVATYKVDATGTLYESHSPRTEVPRLAPPKT